MAWIQMRTNLWDDPRVSRLCDLTGASEAAVIGGLYWLWSAADSHSEDGIMPGLTLKAIDRKTGVPGIGEALCAIGWLADHQEGVRIIRFDEHNGASAKRRALTAKRVAKHAALTHESDKANAGCVSNLQETNASSVSETLGARYLEKEKEKEEERKEKATDRTGVRSGDALPEGFAEFWEPYPRKVSKPQALKAWRKLKLDTQALPAILAGIERDRRSAQWLRDGGQYIPHPATWLNGRRWEDEDETAERAAPERQPWDVPTYDPLEVAAQRSFGAAS